MDLKFTKDEPSAQEREAVDRLLGEADSGWYGGARLDQDHRSSAGGALARSRRDLVLEALHAVNDRVGWVSPGALNYVGQRLTVNQLHDDAAVIADREEFVNAADVWMIECCRQPRFTKEAFPGGLVPPEVLGQDFDRHPAIQGDVFRQEDLPHAALAEFRDDAIVRQRFANHVGVVWRRLQTSS